MDIELIVLAAILVISVIVHVILWRDSTKQHKAIMKEFQGLMERLHQLEANYENMDGVLDAADEDVERIGQEIEALRSALFMGKRKHNLDN